MPLTQTDYGAMWDNHELRPKYVSDNCGCDSCTVEDVCPTNAFKNKRLDLSKCFGCGMCVHYCKNNSFTMDAGNVDLEIGGKKHNIPIICRQSDALRANKLSLKLKKMIKNHEFKL